MPNDVNSHSERLRFLHRANATLSKAIDVAADADDLYYQLASDTDLGYDTLYTDVKRRLADAKNMTDQAADELVRLDTAGFVYPYSFTPGRGLFTKWTLSNTGGTQAVLAAKDDDDNDVNILKGTDAAFFLADGDIVSISGSTDTTVVDGTYTVAAVESNGYNVTINDSADSSIAWDSVGDNTAIVITLLRTA